MPTGSRQIALPVGSDRQVQSLQGNAAVSKIDKSRPGRRVGSPHLPERRHQPKNQRMITVPATAWRAHGSSTSFA